MSSKRWRGATVSRRDVIISLISATASVYLIADTVQQLTASEPLLVERRSSVRPTDNVGAGKLAVAAAPAARKPCMKTYPDIEITSNCTFTGCPAGGPYVYMATSYRNRAASFNRWLRTFKVRARVWRSWSLCCVGHIYRQYVARSVPRSLWLQQVVRAGDYTVTCTCLAVVVSG